MHEVPRDGACFVFYCMVLQSVAHRNRETPELRSFLSAVRTKRGVFCAEELQKGTCQNIIGGVLC